jgi:hypothetical protein
MPPGIRRLLPAEILASELTFRTSSGVTAHGTVASPGPVAGLRVTRAAPDADSYTTALACRCQLSCSNHLSVTFVPCSTEELFRVTAH